jgi:hypothetical protein
MDARVLSQGDLIPLWWPQSGDCSHRVAWPPHTPVECARRFSTEGVRVYNAKRWRPR